VTLKPCMTCGEPSDGTHCDEHRPGPWHHHQASASARGYDNAWNKLSKQARRLQPFCTLCGATDNLTADHLPEAWRRKAAGKRIRLCDVRVLCGPCNLDAGSSRPGTRRVDLTNQGTGTNRRAAVTAEQPQFPLHNQVNQVGRL